MLDMVERAYHMDSGGVDAFMKNFDWAWLYQRCQEAVTCADARLLIGGLDGGRVEVRPLTRRAGG
jgi:hypothetical protein